MKLRNYFTLSRRLDWKTFSNKFVVLYLFATFTFYILHSLIFVTQDPGDIVTYTSAASAALLMFFSWAFAREFHPDDHLTAIVVAVITSIVIAWFPAGWVTNFILLLVVLLSFRLINQTSGVHRVIGDFLVISVLALVGAFMNELWVFTVIPAIAFLINGMFEEKSSQSTIFGTVFTALTIFFVYRFGVVRHTVYYAPLLEYFFLFFGFLTAVSIVTNRKLVSVFDDLSEEKLSESRFLAARAFFIGVTVALLLYTGEFGYLTARSGLILFIIYPVLKFFNE